MEQGKATIELRSPSVYVAISKVSPTVLSSVHHCAQAKPSDLKAFIATLWSVYSAPDTVQGAPSKQGLDCTPAEPLKRRMIVQHGRELPTEYPASLEELTVHEQRLARVPSRISHLAHLRLLDLSRNMIAEVPDALASLFPHLSSLNLSHNALLSIPPGLCHPSLRSLDLSNNRIASIGPELGACGNLDHLLLSGNRIRYSFCVFRCLRFTLFAESCQTISFSAYRNCRRLK